MKHRKTIVACLLLAGVIGLLVAPQALGDGGVVPDEAEVSSPPVPSPAEGLAPSEVEGEPGIFPASEVRSGMTGYGLTTLDGVRPQRFQFEVLGVLKGWFAKGDLILIRMSGPVIDETGVIDGMSGSPIYIDDRLVGAVAYGWLYCRVPMAGVTPAREMMRVLQIDRKAGREQRASAKARARNTLRGRSRRLTDLLTSAERSAEGGAQMRRAVMQMAVPASLRASAAGGRLDAFPPAVRGLLPAGIDPTIRPLPIPLAVGGMAAGGRPLLSLLEGNGFVPVQMVARAGRADATAEAKLEPGVSVGAVFVRGDLDISGMGTLTWIEGDTALAFGHSLFGSGETDIPLALGDVQAVVPSFQKSFKLTAAGRIVGRITQDRESAVLAKIGEEAPTFPCKVRVKGTVDDEYNYRVAGYWETAPMFTFYALASSSARWEGIGNRYTLTARTTISLKGRKEPLVLENVYTSYSVVPPSMDLVVMPMEMLLLNPYREVEIESVDYELEVRPGFEAALIESAWADRVQVEPGSEVTVYVRLRRYRGDQAVKKLKLQVPDTARPGTKVTIIVCDAMTNRVIKRGLDPGFFAPRSFESVVDMLEEMDSNKNLVLRASFFEQGLRYAGGAMPALPPSALSILEHNRLGGEAEPLVTDIEQSVQTPWVLEGSQSVSLTIKQPETYSP